MEEKSQEKEGKKNKTIINVLIFIVILVFALFMYAKYAGTNGLTVKEYRVSSENIPINFSGVKIVYLSDILYGSTVDLSDIKNIVSSINELKPDLVLFGGNLVSEGYKLSDKEKEQLVEELSLIDTKLGKYATKGDLDQDSFISLIESSGFIILENTLEYIYNNDNTPICLVGIGSYNLGKYDLTTSFEYLESNPNCYSIVFTHESDITDKLLALENKPELILAGNSLGGEINIPFYGGLNKFEGSVKYYLDTYSEDGTLIYVSSGIGTRKYNLRLFNKPSINFFRLKSIH